MKTVVMPDNVIKTTEQLQKEEYLFPFMEEDGNMYQVCQDHMHTQPEAALPQQQVPSSNPSRVRAFTYDQVCHSLPLIKYMSLKTTLMTMMIMSILTILSIHLLRCMILLQFLHFR